MSGDALIAIGVSRNYSRTVSDMRCPTSVRAANPRGMRLLTCLGPTMAPGSAKGKKPQKKKPRPGFPAAAQSTSVEETEHVYADAVPVSLGAEFLSLPALRWPLPPLPPTTRKPYDRACTAGIGSTHHLTAELLAKMADAPLLHIPYKGDAAAITALLGGEIPLVVVATPTVAVAQVKAGKLRILAASGGSRWPGMPEVPTAAEAGVPGFHVRSWIGLAAPGGTPRAIIERLNAEIQRALRVPEVRTRLEGLGGEAKGGTPQEMKERVIFEGARWKKVIADSKIPQQQERKNTMAKMPDMNTPLFKKGLAVRTAVVGADYVDKALSTMNEFNAPMQKLVTEWCWGDVWARPGISRQTRSMLNLAMLCALNRPHELRTHVRGALTNGVTPREIQEVLLQVAVYCGVPAGIEGFRIATEVVKEFEAAAKPARKPKAAKPKSAKAKT